MPCASAAIPDFAFPETGGHRPPDLDRTLKLRRALNRLAAADPAIHQRHASLPDEFALR